ncbi:PAS domain S-box protein [Myxococcaceae bacterium GXIMD 01537]
MATPPKPQLPSTPSEDRFRLVVDNLREVVFQTDAVGHWTYLNRAWKELTGFGVEESLGRYFLDFLHPEDRQRQLDLARPLVAGERELFRQEVRYLTREGGYRWVEVFARLILAEDGTLSGTSGTLVDITERKQASDALGRRERYLTGLVEMQQRLLAARDGEDPYRGVLEPVGVASGASRVYVFDTHRDAAGVLLMSQRAEWCADGVTPEINNPLLQNMPVEPDLARWGHLLVNNEVVTGLVRDFPESERAILEPQGILSILVLPLRVDDRWVGFIGFDNCTEARAWDKLEVDLLSAAAGALSLALEQRRSERALREREKRFRKLAENASDVLYRYRLEEPPGFEYVSRLVGSKLGLSPQEHYADPELWHRVVHPSDRAALSRLLSGRGTSPGQPAVLRFTASDGRTLWLEHLVTPVMDAGGQPVAVEGLARDITERRQAEEALRLSEASFRLLLEGVPDAVAIQRDGRIVYANAALVSTLGFEHAGELMDRALGDFVETEEGGEGGPGKGMLTGERRLKRRDGKPRRAEFASLPLLFDGQPAVVSIARDVTEQRQLQARLTLADRLASMGTLSAGIAHEINNPLAFVISNLGFLSDAVSGALRGTEPPDMEEWQVVLSEACEGAERVRQIVRQLKAFSRADEERIHPVDVHAVLDSVVMMAANEIRHRAQLKRDWGATTPVLANEGRLSQVFLNLIVNAAQAISEGDAHRNEVRLSTRNDELGRVVVEVRDTGVGIPREIVGRIFDPFFTTKPVGLGTGLGLSVCHGIVSSLGGEITVESEVGRGTTFRVVLPSAEPWRARASGAARGEEPCPRRGRVLVVDDEPGVGRVLKRVLREHEVEVAGGGREALGMLERTPSPFDAILCDVMMPDLAGRELYEAVRVRRPGLEQRFIFLSGGAFTSGAREFLASIPNPLLEKPFDEALVRRVVHELVLAGPSSR